jgi:hypothetical protein
VAAGNIELALNMRPTIIADGNVQVVSLARP